MALFGKKQQQPAPVPGSDIPTPLVLQMRAQGFSDNQIVQALQRDGVSANQIFDAMNQADLQATNQGQEMVEQSAPPEYNPPPMQEAPPMMPGPMPPPMQMTNPESDRERIEEVAEAIIDEKWEEFIKNLNKVIEWKDRTEAKVAQLEQQFKDLQNNYDNLHKAVIGKIGEYDQNIVNVGVEIKAMERVFQKILPTLTDNVNELSRLTKTIKEPKAEKTLEPKKKP
jgi:hypothetical protein